MVEYFVCMIEQFNVERCQVGTMAHQIQMFIKYGTKINKHLALNIPKFPSTSDRKIFEYIVTFY